MKVGVFNDANIPSHFAHSFNVMKMAQGFLNAGCDAEVITCHSLDVVRRKIKYGDIKSHYGLTENIKITWLLPSMLAWMQGDTQNDYAYAKRAVSYAVKHNMELIFARSFRIPILSVKAGLPTVIEAHTTDYKNPMLQKVYEIAELPAFKGLVTIHQDIAAEHAKRGVPENKLIVLEDGVDLQRFQVEDDRLLWRKKLGLDPELKYVVYCGHLYADKGIEVLLDAAEYLIDRKDIKFILAGGQDEDRFFWQKKCYKKGLSNIIFTGFIRNSQVPTYLKAADCLVLPYKTKMNFKVMDIHTTSPLKLFEYLAAARPIVATDIPTVAKVLRNEKSGLLVSPEDSVAFSDAILKVVDNIGYAKSLAEESSSIASQYSWTNRCSKILEQCK